MKDGLLVVLVGLLFVLAVAPLVSGYVYSSVMHGAHWGGGMMAGDEGHSTDDDHGYPESHEECEDMMHHMHMMHGYDGMMDNYDYDSYGMGCH